MEIPNNRRFQNPAPTTTDPMPRAPRPPGPPARRNHKKMNGPRLRRPTKPRPKGPTILRKYSNTSPFKLPNNLSRHPARRPTNPDRYDGISLIW